MIFRSRFVQGLKRRLRGLRAFADLPEDPKFSSEHSTSSNSHPSLTPTPEDMTPSSGIYGYPTTHGTHPYKQRHRHICIHANKIYKQVDLFSELACTSI